MESEVLAQQAAANTKEQFSSSPDFRREMENAAITGMENHQEMVRQMLSDDQIKARIMEMLADLVWTGFQSKDAQNRKQA